MDKHGGKRLEWIQTMIGKKSNPNALTSSSVHRGGLDASNFGFLSLLLDVLIATVVILSKINFSNVMRLILGSLSGDVFSRYD